jgi:hypothetical protein
MVDLEKNLGEKVVSLASRLYSVTIDESSIREERGSVLSERLRCIAAFGRSHSAVLCQNNEFTI